MIKNENFDLTVAFVAEDVKRIQRTFQRLAKYLPSYALTGGIATIYYFGKYDFLLQKRDLNDLDVVTSDPNELLSSVKQDFLISHYHPKNHKGKFHIMLVDPKTKLRIDIFPYLTNAHARLKTVVIKGQSFSILSLEDLVCRLLSNCVDVIRGKTVDPKYVLNMLSLMGICDKSLVREVWNEYKKEEEHFDVTYWKVVTSIKDEPNLLQKTIYSQDLNFICEACDPRKNLPLATNQQIYDLIGYV